MPQGTTKGELPWQIRRPSSAFATLSAGLDDVEMKPESTLDEIGLDSLGTVEILVAVEDEFGIQLDTEENPKTVGEFADTVEAALEK